VVKFAVSIAFDIEEPVDSRETWLAAADRVQERVEGVFADWDDRSTPEHQRMIGPIKVHVRAR